MYTRAMAEERAVRAESATPTLAQIHHVIASYEAIVRKHPASGYCDNALWQGGSLALLAFERQPTAHARRAEPEPLAYRTVR